MSTLERLGSLDMTWLQIERSTNLMQVIGVLVLATPLDRNALADCLRTRLLPLSELRRHPALAGMRLLQPGNRLSITPVSAAEWAAVLNLLES